jgi:hypothetical protein
MLLLHVLSGDAASGPGLQLDDDQQVPLSELLVEVLGSRGIVEVYLAWSGTASSAA